MPETQNLGTLQHISADAVGQPGQRRFRLRLITQSPQYAYVWLEKEQLIGLKDAIVTILTNMIIVQYLHSRRILYFLLMLMWNLILEQVIYL